MRLGYAQIEELLEARHDIDAAHHAAFRGRLQHLQRREFPSGVNTGKGRRATYGWRQVVELAVCFDLMECGLSPDAAISIVNDSSSEIIRAVKGLVRHARGRDCVENGLFADPISIDATRILSVNPLALRTLKSDEGQKPINEILRFDDLKARMHEEQDYLPASVLVDLGGLLATVFRSLGKYVSGPLSLEEEIAKWVDS